MAFNIVNLAKTVLAQVETVDASLKAAGQPGLSMGLDGGVIPLTDPTAQVAKEIAIGAAQQLIALLSGPSGVALNLALAQNDIAAMKVLHRFQIANAFPVGETSTYAAIATKCGISENRVRRVLRFAMTSGVFVEVQPGLVGHTAMSRALAQDPHMRPMMGQLVDEQCTAAPFLAESLEQFGESQEPTEAAWGLAHRASKPMFAELQDKYPARARQFGSFMDVWATHHSTQPLVEMVDWATIAAAAKPSIPHFVDIGGGKGHVCGSLAQALPEFTFTVQDYADTIRNASSVLPESVRDRVRYQAHDFMSDIQPVHGADVYYFRSIFHDWPDKSCVQILRNLIPALKPGARIILNELCITSAPLIPPLERITRGLDMVMLSFFNGEERSREDFERLFREADPRFEFVGAREPALDPMGLPKMGMMSIVEVVWKG